MFFESAGLGAGHTGPGPRDSYGTISYNITHGNGIFTGAQGWMSDIFIGSENDAGFDINALAIFWLPIAQSRTSQMITTSSYTASDYLRDSIKSTRMEFASVFDSYVSPGGECLGEAPSQVLISELGTNVELFFILKNDTNSSQILQWRSTSTRFSNGSFSQIGNISIANSDVGMIHFSSRSAGRSGQILSFPFSGITLDITNGSGIWADASGSLLATTVRNGDNHLTLFVWAVFWIPSA